MKTNRFILVTVAWLLMWTATAVAVPTFVQSVETPECDVLPPLTLVDELGLAPIFPPDEQINAIATFTQQSACPPDDPAIPNARVRITNLTGRSWVELYYVADTGTAAPFTTITNFDGLVNRGQAFRIDTVGVNRPLVFESIAADGVFAPGEIWDFIIDDYVNIAGISPDAFNSIGVGFLSPFGPSSGSIIGIVPEPSSVGAAVLAGAILLSRSKRR